MKRIATICVGVALMASSVSLTGCIDETFPTDGATAGQVGESSDAVEALVGGLNSYATEQWTTQWMPSFGYPALMIIRNIQSGEMAYGDDLNGCLYMNWVGDLYLSREYLVNQFLWYYETAYAGAANKAMNSINVDASDEMKGYYAVALAYRAMLYLDMAREYEWQPNDKTQPISPEQNSIEGLTVPIVTEDMTEEQWKNNPRATRAQMSEFILGDLQQAAEWINFLPSSSKTMPHLDCVYGLMARCYMWLGEYGEAQKYARMAIDASSTTPITREQGLSTTSGFNDINQFMWGSQYAAGNVNNLYCWTANMCNEISYGYTGTQLGTYVRIDSDMYSRISNTDWRKLLWKAPAGSALDGDNTYIDDEVGAGLPDYASLKFRPGGGSTNDYSTGNVTGFPFMRIEEMYLIEAEAAAHTSAAEGIRLLETFMRQYRDPAYTCRVSDPQAVIDEIVFQKAIELWGEGQYWFDVKRLGYPVVRNYNGSNHTSAYLYNSTTELPAWMNWQISQMEEMNNRAVNGYNNPMCSGLYAPTTSQQ